MKRKFLLILAFCAITNCYGQTTEEYNHRGITKAKLKDYEAAIADFTKAIEINPNNEQAYYNRGNAKSKLKDYKGAIADFNKAIKINPKDFDAYNSRGLAKIFIEQKSSGCLDFSTSKELGNEMANQLIAKFCN